MPTKLVRFQKQKNTISVHVLNNIIKTPITRLPPTFR